VVIDRSRSTDLAKNNSSMGPRSDNRGCREIVPSSAEEVNSFPSLYYEG
jgi:hypothetical protein